MADLILEAVGVSFSYPDGTKALNGVNLAIPRGKKIALLGPNGAGKSTLFLHFNGILRPSQGVIRFAGQDLSYSHAALKSLRKNVGIVFQDPDSQLFSASVRQEVSFGPLNLGWSKEQVLRCVEEAMEATEISHLQDKPTHLLSYGQKKRVAIAAVLAMAPQVLIFDEPTAWLDPRHSQEIIALIQRLNQQGKTIVLSTHDVDLAYGWADYCYILKDGVVVGEGLPHEVFARKDLLAQTDLKRPWILEVFEELQKKGYLAPTTPVPRTKEELFACLKANPAKGSQALKAIQSG